MSFKRNARHLLDGTTAVLFAIRYKWQCPGCAEINYATAAYKAVACFYCQATYKVASLSHLIDGDLQLPKTAIADLHEPTQKGGAKYFDEKVIPVETMLLSAESEISMVAASYGWRCPECDWLSHRARASLADVECDKCHSGFPISEIRHKQNEMETGWRMHPGARWKTEEAVGEMGSENETASETNHAAQPRVLSAKHKKLDHYHILGGSPYE